MYKRSNLMLSAALKQEILAFVDSKCAQSTDGFRAEFIPCCLAAPLTYVKKETEEEFYWQLQPSSAPEGVLEALQRAVDTLPDGVTGKLSTKRTVTSRWDGAEAHEVQYYLDITVSPQYAAAHKEETL